jgi:hypothetical protein
VTCRDEPFINKLFRARIINRQPSGGGLFIMYS